LRRWLTAMPAAWRAMVRVVSVDPHEGYRSAVTNTSLVAEVTVVVDPFHVVRLANQALTRCRQRVQQATLGHRGRAADPLYNTRKLFLLGAERVDRVGWGKIRAAWRDGDPDGEVFDATLHPSRDSEPDPAQSRRAPLCCSFGVGAMLNGRNRPSSYGGLVAPWALYG
jgi:transposase